MRIYNLLLSAFLLVIFVYLFLRQVRIDIRQNWKKKIEGDLHVLREMKKFYDEHNLQAKEMENAIREMERQLNEHK